jgi:rod shape-determining protein MreB
MKIFSSSKIKTFGFFKNIRRIFRRFTRTQVAIDLGTANTLIYCAKEGIVLNEPSVVAVTEIDGNLVVVAVGSNAKKMIGRSANGQKMRVVRPLKDGVISDFDLAYLMLKGFLDKAFDGSIGFLPKKVIIGTPSGATSVERRAIKESVEGQVELIPEPLAAAIGANLPIGNPSGHMIIDIGGGTTEIAVIALGDIVNCNSVKIAGDTMDDAIIATIRKDFHVLIGYTMAEHIKKVLGAALLLDLPNDKLEIKGRDLYTGMPKAITIDRKTICGALASACIKIIEEIKIILSGIDPVISADIMQNGIYLAGGGALLPNFDKLIEQEIGIKVFIAPDPLYAVVNGLGKILENKNVTDITYN